MSKAKDDYNEWKNSGHKSLPVHVSDKVIKELESEKAELIKKLKFIKEFGYKNHGCGFSCAKVADDILQKYEVKP